MGLSDDEGDPNPCPEDAVFHVPDADSMEEAIDKSMEGVEGQERAGFNQIHRLLQRLPVQVQMDIRRMTHAEAIEADFLPNMSEEEHKRFTPPELVLYKHTLEYKRTVGQLKKVIAMLRQPEFDSKEIDPESLICRSK
jgi:hypothetical protein